MISLATYTAGTRCSVIIESNGRFVRRNGIVNSEIKHLPGVWCVELTQREVHEPYFVKAYSQYYEILEEMSLGESIENAFDELAFI